MLGNEGCDWWMLGQRQILLVDAGDKEGSYWRMLRTRMILLVDAGRRRRLLVDAGTKTDLMGGS